MRGGRVGGGGRFGGGTGCPVPPCCRMRIAHWFRGCPSIAVWLQRHRAPCSQSWLVPLSCSASSVPRTKGADHAGDTSAIMRKRDTLWSVQFDGKKEEFW